MIDLLKVVLLGLLAAGLVVLVGLVVSSDSASRAASGVQSASPRSETGETPPAGTSTPGVLPGWESAFTLERGGTTG